MKREFCLPNGQTEEYPSLISVILLLTNAPFNVSSKLHFFFFKIRQIKLQTKSLQLFTAELKFGRQFWTMFGHRTSEPFQSVMFWNLKRILFQKNIFRIIYFKQIQNLKVSKSTFQFQWRLLGYRLYLVYYR